VLAVEKDQVFVAAATERTVVDVLVGEEARVARVEGHSWHQGPTSGGPLMRTKRVGVDERCSIDWLGSIA
jgi:hypothetical protein